MRKEFKGWFTEDEKLNKTNDPCWTIPLDPDGKPIPPDKDDDENKLRVEGESE